MVLLLASMVLPGAAPLTETAQAVTQSDIDALEDNAENLAKQRREVRAQLAELKNDRANAIYRRNLLDQEIVLTEKEITNTENQIAGYDAMLSQTAYELAENEKEEEIQYALFCERARIMEEEGTPSFWEVFFSAEDFSDLLSRLDAANEIIEYRNGVIETLRKLQKQIKDKKSALEDQLGEQEEAKKELVERKSELSAQVAEATALINDIQKDQNAAQALLDAKEKEYNRIQQQIKDKEAELAASLGPATVGGYIWPETVSKRITSPHGSRFHPVYKKWKTHNGVDIGGVGYTTPVLATKAGVVIISQRSSSYGHYVVVSHGTGNTTLYAHMSSRAVKVGDKVTQGQKIGVTGSTGVSTGPHLHYEITEGGKRIDPLKYLPGYVKAWS